jgi:Rab GDP dissociation inhibitor
MYTAATSIGLPEGFSRLAAVNGGVYMLNKGVDEILFNEDGVAWGIKTDNEVREEDDVDY